MRPPSPAVGTSARLPPAISAGDEKVITTSPFSIVIEALESLNSDGSPASATCSSDAGRLPSWVCAYCSTTIFAGSAE